MTEKTMMMPVKMFLNKDIGATVRVVKNPESELREVFVGVLLLTHSNFGSKVYCISGKNVWAAETDQLDVLVTKRKYNKWWKAFRRTDEYKNLVKENSK